MNGAVRRVRARPKRRCRDGIHFGAMLNVRKFDAAAANATEPEWAVAWGSVATCSMCGSTVARRDFRRVS